ncbi:hypothetical protein C2E21_8597 [Chlorella sorokiniana]|uniref:Uncharacterized protein n=1 Tax=Chlorella sorokiniana TaxID=3076 RepID=A0A2P6TE12_CHLSO|nr:hypothetical protein C2E21_8597 [Chlorella sorokiniana]|eukprot:PRW20875.1 hypothetical protein C2E21_8597 [Chlorella sorokiniana]
MYPFDSARGRLALGLAVASGGGMVLTFLMQQTTDPKRMQQLQLALVFWLIFVGKTTLAYMRQIGSGEVAVPAGGRGAARGSKPKAEAQPADSEDTQELPARRRRTRRD